MTSVSQANDADSNPVPRSSLASNAGFRNFAPLAQTAGADITTHPSWADAAEQVPPQPASCGLLRRHHRDAHAQRSALRRHRPGMLAAIMPFLVPQHPTKLRHEMKVVTASAHPMPEDVLYLRPKLLTPRHDGPRTPNRTGCCLPRLDVPVKFGVVTRA